MEETREAPTVTDFCFLIWMQHGEPHHGLDSKTFQPQRTGSPQSVNHKTPIHP